MPIDVSSAGWALTLSAMVSCRYAEVGGLTEAQLAEELGPSHSIPEVSSVHCSMWQLAGIRFLHGLLPPVCNSH